MGRPKRTYPLGSFRLRLPKDADKDKKYPIELEYTWNSVNNNMKVYQKII